MKINKLIVCVASFASVGFASNVSFDGQENCKIGNVGLKPVKRERPAGGSVSINKSMPGVDRRALADVTNIVDGPRHRKQNPRYLDSSTEQGVKKYAVAGRKIVRAKRAGAVLSDNSSGHTTLEKDSVSSRASSFDSSGASSPILTNDDVVDDFDFDFDDPEERIFASPVVTTSDWKTAYSALAQKETPFELGGSYKGQECSPFYTARMDLLSLNPLSPRNDEFEQFVKKMSSNKTLF